MTGRIVGAVIFAGALAACGSSQPAAPAGTLRPLVARNAAPSPSASPITQMDDSTIEHGPTRVQGGSAFRITGRSLPGASIRVSVTLPFCGFDDLGTETTTRSTVPADGSYVASVRVDPRWTRANIVVLLVDESSGAAVSETMKLAVLPAGRPEFCSPAPTRPPAP